MTHCAKRDGRRPLSRPPLFVFPVEAIWPEIAPGAVEAIAYAPRRSLKSFRADNVWVLVEHGADLVDIGLVDKARASRHLTHRSQAELCIVVGEEHP